MRSWWGVGRVAGSTVAVAAAMLLAATACTSGAPVGRPTAAAPKPAQSAACSYLAAGVVGFAGSGLGAGREIVLGRVSVRPGFSQPAVRVEGPWPYWQKNGIEILAGTPVVSISLPASWRRRAAITWGTSGTVSSLQLAACSRPARVWDAYAGGFYLRSAAACVPLVFRIRGRSTTVRFGVGGPCG